MHDADATADPNNDLRRRVVELESIISAYKQSCTDEPKPATVPVSRTKGIVTKVLLVILTTDFKVTNRPVEVQVNLTAEIYRKYEFVFESDACGHGARLILEC
jgi:hypothetical protein